MDLSRYFPKKPAIQAGVDIGSGVLKIALLQLLPNRIRLLSYKCQDLSHFKEEDEKKDAFILQQVEDFIKAHGLFTKSIHLNLPITNAVYTKTIKLPRMPANEIPKAAKWQIKDEAALNIKETEFAWQYAFPQTRPLKPRIDIVCVAVKKDFLNRYIELFRRSNIALSEITFSPFSINSTLPVDEEWSVILDIGYKQSVFSMHSRGKILFLRTIHLGASNFKEGAEATEQNRQRPYLEHLSDEIVRSVKYCELEFAKKAINRIYLTGGGAKLETLQVSLGKVSGLDIKIARFPRNMQVDESIRKGFEVNRDSLQILPAVGAAMTSASKIDVLPLEARTEKLLLAERISFRLIGLTTMLILILSVFAIRLNLNITKKRLSNARAELAFLKEGEALKIEIDEYNRIINKINQEYIPPHWPLKFVSNLLPENMVLNFFVFNNRDKHVNMRGAIYTRGDSAEEVITDFIRKIKKLELFKDIRLVSIERTSGDSFNFNIVCDLFS